MTVTLRLLFFMEGYTVGVAGQTVNLLSLDSGSATLSPSTNFYGVLNLVLEQIA